MRRLTWFGHVKKRPNTVLIRNILDWQVNGESRRRVRLLKTWIKAVKNDFKGLGLTDDMWKNHLLFRTNIRVADSATSWNVLWWWCSGSLWRECFFVGLVSLWNILLINIFCGCGWNVPSYLYVLHSLTSVGTYTPL